MPSLLNPGPPSSMNFFSSSMPLPSFFFRNRKKCYDLNPPEESHQVTYLGNMLTIMGKGDASVDRPLEVITRAWDAACAKGGARHGTTGTFGHQQQQPQLAMRLCVCRSGLRAETSMGVTEYFTHRITWSAAPSQYPRIFCWIYKHEGKRMKPELRCHAVLCRRTEEPQRMHQTLRRHLQFALQEYKREKVAAERTRHRRNSVLQFASSVVGAACASGAAEMCQHQQQQQATAMTMVPRRKAVLQTGTLNFRPPLSRARSVPRLCSIDEEEARVEDEEEEDEDEDEDELLLSSSDVDSLNTADHYQPMPMPTVTTTTPPAANREAATTSGASSSTGADQQTITSTTDSSCRSSACDDDEHVGDEDEDDEDEQRGRHFRKELFHHHNHSHRHFHLRTNAIGRESGDDDCSADSGYSAALHT